MLLCCLAHRFCLPAAFLSTPTSSVVLLNWFNLISCLPFPVSHQGSNSGLLAELLAADCCEQVIVVEARDRVGGRVCTMNNWGEVAGVKGTVVDLGASFIQGCFSENPIYRAAQVPQHLSAA